VPPSAPWRRLGVSVASAGSLPVSAEMIGRLGWLIRLRWLAVAGVAVFLEVARRIFPVHLSLRPLYLTLGFLALCNLAYQLALRRLRQGSGSVTSPGARGLARFLLPPPPGGLGNMAEAGQAALFANVQVAVDLLLLATLLHFSGGIENPFLYFFIFHVIIASILFSRQATYVHASWGVALVSAVAVNECVGVLRHFPLGGAWAPDSYREPTVVAAQLLVFASTLYLSAYMGSSIAEHLRRREGEVVVLSLEVARKAETLAAALERVTEAERAKSQYMRKVAHELRGPLGTIRTTMSALLGNVAGGLPQPARELVERVAARAGGLADVTADLLALARAREGRLAVELAPVDLAALVREMLADARATAEGAGVRATGQVAEEPCEIVGDAAALRGMVGNLLANALRYTPAGGAVEVRLARRAGSAVLDVEDSGIGIAAEELPRIFEEFYRAGNARSHSAEGTGLGLAIVKAAAEQHGGQVSVRSAPGQGTCFTVTLPLPIAAPGAG